MTVDLDKRAEVKRLVEEQAVPILAPCPRCSGEGVSDEVGRRVVHSFRGPFGADWDVESVLAAIDNAAEVGWRKSIFGHELTIVEQDGRVVSFDVKRPEGTR